MHTFFAGMAGIFVVAFLTGLTGAATPGPLLAFTVTAAARRGPSVGFLVVAGHAIIESTLVMIIFLGAATILNNVALQRVTGAVGAVVLVVMGALMLRDLPKMSLCATLSDAIAEGRRPSRLQHPVVGGLLLTLVNPTFPVWWAGVGFALVAQYGTTLGNVGVFYAGHISSDLLWYVLVASVVALGRRFISDRVYRVFIGACAIFLIVIALAFAWNAVTGNVPAARADTASRASGPAQPEATPAAEGAG